MNVSNDDERYFELMESAMSLDHSLPKLSMLEEAARIADSISEKQLAVYARTALIETARFIGKHEKILTAFPWILSAHDESPDLLPGKYLLQLYSLTWTYSFGFPEITIDQLLAMGKDIEARTVKCGIGLQAHFRYVTLNYVQLGDYQAASDHYDRWCLMHRDASSDPIIFDLATKAWILMKLGRIEDALLVIDEVLNQSSPNDEVTNLMYELALFPVAESGRLAEADRYSHIGYTAVENRLDNIGINATHLHYMLYRNDIDRALRCGQCLLRNVTKIGFPYDQLNMFAALNTLVAFLLNKDPELALSLRVPKLAKTNSDELNSDPHALGDWLKQRESDLIARFNLRNGNDYVETEIKNLRAKIFR